MIVGTEKGDIPLTNPFHNGNAWFVSQLKMVANADEEMKVFGKIDTKDVATLNEYEFGSPRKDNTHNSFTKDSLASIKLYEYKANDLKYTSNNSNDGFAVFSEIYYKNGWKATVDGKETPILKVDYTLRGIEIPKGKHTIEFKFEPQVVKTGSTIALFSSIGMLLVIIGGVYVEQKKKK